MLRARRPRDETTLLGSRVPNRPRSYFRGRARERLLQCVVTHRDLDQLGITLGVQVRCALSVAGNVAWRIERPRPLADDARR